MLRVLPRALARDPELLLDCAKVDIAPTMPATIAVTCAKTMLL